MPIQDINKNNLRELIKNNHHDSLEIIDVRAPFEYEAVHIKGSKLIPMNELMGRLDEVDWDKDVIFICRSGSRSKLMASMVTSKKDNIKNLQYGIYECFADGKGKNLEIDENTIDQYF